MTTRTQGTGGPDGRPLCWNAEPMPQSYLANDGHDKAGQLRRVVIPWAFSRECKSWVADPSTDPVPLAEGWKCAGCCHLPREAVAAAISAAARRRWRK